MEIRTGCKINLGLDVLGRREDGYHEAVMNKYNIFFIVNSFLWLG